MKKPRLKCKRCGETLAPVYTERSVLEMMSPGPAEPFVRKLLGYGFAATNFFCSLTCGHWYAVDHLRFDEPGRGARAS